MFERLRGTIDQQQRRHGRFLLLGSIAPTLMARVSQSLASRLSLVELTPLLWSELATAAQRERLWLFGGFPDGGVLAPKHFPRWQKDKIALLTQRDLPAWGLAAMLAALHGQAWNAASVSRSLALSYHTVNRYLDCLEGTFLIRRLRPWSANVGKRLVKSPKVCWRDSGLLHALLGVADRDHLLAQPWVGASFEGFVIEQLLGALSVLGSPRSAWHFRTSDQLELDLVLERGRERIAFEIKLTTSPSPADMARLEKVAALIGANRRVLVSRVSHPTGDATRLSGNLAHLLDMIGRW
ncbi:MAG: DUF4143 domain-containing protein [Planctomycetes bacterium]|nr:DUF4143 domain-containing protein [Planctomycetota bacterium]